MTSSGERGLLLWDGGTVCDDDFGDSKIPDAICKELGFARSIRWSSDENFLPHDGQDELSITLDEISCKTSEWSSCSYNSENHNCEHHEDVTLTCERKSKTSLL